MAGITGQGTTFNLPNFVGELFGISPEDTPLLSSIGGLTGGVEAKSKEFEWEYYDLRTPAVGRERLEGAAPPSAESRVRANASNVLQIVQEAVEVSYTKQGAINQIDSGSLVSGVNPVTNEFDWQTDKALKQIARDVNYSFINGTYAKPADNLTPRKTRGLLAAIATNVVTLAQEALPALDVSSDESATDIVVFGSAHGLSNGDRVQFSAITGGTGLAAATPYFVIVINSTSIKLSTVRGGTPIDITTNMTAGTLVKLGQVSTDSIGNAMQMAYDNGGLLEGETRVAVVGPLQKRRLTKALITDVGYKETSRNVGGVNLQVIETDFGPLNIMLERAMPADTLVFASLEELAPVFMNIPGKGFLFLEALAKTAASDAAQIYGEVGLKYGNERKHAKITGAG